ncbi:MULTISPECIES: N-acetyl-gamma-glutamyl-phosphate reductase [unclassified Gilliamella]|uniref:N-acetyl-gamma-glutamyl-phosphate reductase n=1 Tax=unclassified Gilliamella TaxID=2685620 RepID=UPI001307550C|nr:MULTISPECIES: N-acetyl-gamma-glutamyl-phosphate reductase [unclassified Gilliamella]MWP49124.1 N-acetyl-gamma-glutamyl-phosphate reductase [Gilliamella sp. Lep-s35]MWP69262.1 N-acetyl-gamma-glutamyl-phosphate reductase [Gilliamella sp. Lep-s5]MWP76825.1 N-acetyl-gamma-glutamyl-phosphate reductase [Gilliamella sp. Lep-s21]
MLKAIIIGASGYAGAKLAYYLHKHPHIELIALTVSENSQDGGKLISDYDLHPQLKGVVDLPLTATADYSSYINSVDVVFLATEHAVSHNIAPYFLEHGCTVFDLSGAFRVNSATFYTDYYGFTHQHQKWLDKAVYGLAEWNSEEIKGAQLIAVPGCYPTASQLPLKPLIEEGLLDNSQWPVINAVSGVSGAGRKPSHNNLFCEVSLHAYGLFTHRHHPEIATHLGQEVIFTPHLGSFKQGIHATITCRVKESVTSQDVLNALNKYYQNKPLIRVYQKDWPALKSVIGLPYCDIGFVLKDRHLILISVEDNLLKGAAAQAVQCMNIRFGFDETTSLL